GAPPETTAARVWRAVQGVAGPAGLVALALALVYAALGLALGGRRRAALAAGVLGAVGVIAAAGGLVTASRTEGVVTAATEVRSGPAPDAARDGALAPGTVVRLGERRGAWQHVRADDVSGWAPAGSVEPL
ncbi:MAG TPA: SH3 domain-containing protein, partial [Rubricoccaceae bacterium]